MYKRQDDNEIETSGYSIEDIEEEGDRDGETTDLFGAIFGAGDNFFDDADEEEDE